MLSEVPTLPDEIDESFREICMKAMAREADQYVRYTPWRLELGKESAR